LSLQAVFEFLQLSLFLQPGACGGSERLSATGALPQVNGNFDFARFSVWGAVPFFD